MQKRNHNFKDLTNQNFGYLTVLNVDETKSNSNHIYWTCQCICGTQRSLQTYQLTSGKVTSCGCKNRLNLMHNLIKNHKRMYSVYITMKARCNNPKSINYKTYGAKGITVCKQWQDDFAAFIQWAETHGYQDNLSIDRIDNSKGYQPDNCRWIPLKEQFYNKTNNVFYTHNNQTLTMKEWCDKLNYSYCTARSRRKYAKKLGIEPTFEFVFNKKISRPHLADFNIKETS